MSRKSKVSSEMKVQLVEQYFLGKLSCTVAAKVTDVDPSSLREWILGNICW